MVKLIIHLDGRTIRGNEIQVFAVARRLRSSGHDVVAACRANTPVDAALREAGIQTSSVLPSGDLDPIGNLRFALWLRRQQADCILLTSWRKALVAGWAARFAGIPRIILRVGGVHTQKRAIDRWKYRRALTRYVDLIIVNSSTVKTHLLEAIGGLREARLHLIPNGIDTTTSVPRSLREELGISQDSVLLFSAGGLEHRKGFDVLIEAVASLEPNVHLVIAGEGPQRNHLKTLAAAAGMEPRLHLLGQRSDVPALLSGSDVFVMSSRSEGMPVAMLEAMAARKPVVSTDVGGVAEALARNGARAAGGWVVARDDAAALRLALDEVISLLKHDPAAVRARIDEATWRVENWFSTERMTEEYERVLLDRELVT